jgi:hypothetical protein
VTPSLLLESHFSWTMTVRCVAGALMGIVIGTFLFYGIGIPIGTMLAWCVLTRPARSGSSVRRLHEISVCYSPCIRCWQLLMRSKPDQMPLPRRHTAGSVVDVVMGSYNGSVRMPNGDFMTLPSLQNVSYNPSADPATLCSPALMSSSLHEGVAPAEAGF